MFSILAHFVLYLVFHVHFLCDLVSKVGSFFHSVQFPSVWTLDHIVAVHRYITTLKLPQLQLTIYSPQRYWWKSKQCRRHNKSFGQVIGWDFSSGMQCLSSNPHLYPRRTSVVQIGHRDSGQPFLIQADCIFAVDVPYSSST